MMRIGKKELAYIYLYTAQLQAKKKNGKETTEKKREERIDVICFHLYEALGFGKLGEGMRR